MEPGARVARALVAAPIAERDVIALAVGKAAHTMLAGARQVLAERIVSAICIVPDGVTAPGAIAAGHPVPDARSEAAGRALLARAAAARPGQRILALISGGGSALAAVPADRLSLHEKAIACAAVARAGAPIGDLNCVRKHLSALKGGRLAAAATVPVTTLVASDVVGDDPATVASGPTCPDPTTFEDALDVVRRAAVEREIGASAIEHLRRGARGEGDETPKRARPGDRVEVISGIRAMVDAAVAEGEAAGLAARAVGWDLADDVESVASRIAAEVARAAAGCVVWGGEPTIALPAQPGVGGRAHQLALLCARQLRGVPDFALLVAGTDGQDGNTGAAGAIIDGQTWDAAIARGLDPERALEARDAGSVLGGLGAQIATGPTGVNHADLVILLRW